MCACLGFECGLSGCDFLGANGSHGRPISGVPCADNGFNGELCCVASNRARHAASILAQRLRYRPCPFRSQTHVVAALDLSLDFLRWQMPQQLLVRTERLH